MEQCNEIENVEMKFIPGYEGLYSATRDGRIYRHHSSPKKRGFLGLKRNTLYVRVCLVKDGVSTWHAVHRLIALTFIPNPHNKPQVNHINFNRHDNRVENLEWVTWEENWRHARSANRYKGNMLTEFERQAVGLLYKSGKYTVNMLVKMFNSSDSSVRRHIQAYR